MSKKKRENKSPAGGKRKIIIWVVSVAASLVLFGSLLYREAYQNYKSQTKETIKKAVETMVTKPSSEDPGKITQFEISIPKIGVSAPVLPNVDGTSQRAYDEALKGGVAHFAGTALPNSGSNIFIFGHSSSVFGTGKYDKIFAKLNNLIAGDTVTINFNGKAYSYKVATKKIISATDTSVLSPTDSEQLTLMTCWPVGTDQKRLVVTSTPLK